MIHVATVHWKDDRWIPIQEQYFLANMGESYRMYGFLNDIDPQHRGRFFYSSTEPIKSHAIKLNLLADVISYASTSDDDIIMFIDGDAFPIVNVSEYSRPKLKEYPLMAVQRLENNGDLQPHPSFCITTVGFWRRIKGDWKKGYKWINESGREVTDVGGNLLCILQQEEEAWLPLLRSNTVDLHGVWFGIYGDVVYHHGAGFRSPHSRMDLEATKAKAPWLLQKLDGISSRLPPRTAVKYMINKRLKMAFGNRMKEVVQQNQRLSEEVFLKLQQDMDFYKMFLT